MKTIAMFSGYYEPYVGGVISYTYNIAKNMKKKGYKVIIITTKYDDSLKDVEIVPYGKIYRLPVYKFKSKRFPVIKKNKKYRELFEEIKKENIDSIILHTRFWTTSYIGAKFARKEKIPVCLIEHGSSHSDLGNKILTKCGEIYEHQMTKKLKKYVKDFYGCSEKSTNWIRHFNIEPKGTIYNSIDVQNEKKYEKYINKENEKEILTFVGRMVEGKGIFRLIEAFKQLEKKHNNLELHIIGDGLIFNKMIKENQNEKNIKIYGELSHGEIMKILGKTTIFVNSSYLSEGLPTTILEAAMMECAIVTTYSGGSVEIITDNIEGIVCGFNSKDIEKGIERIIGNKKEQKRLSQNAKKKVIEKFSSEKVTEDLLKKIELK